MCFIIRSKKEGTKQMATENIPVKKQLLEYSSITGELKSPYRDMIYEEGKTYKSDLENPYLDPSVSAHPIINIGLHSYNPKGGFDGKSYYDMYIPIGAYYYKNDDEYVSDTLVFAPCPKKSLLKRIISYLKKS